MIIVFIIVVGKCVRSWVCLAHNKRKKVSCLIQKLIANVEENRMNYLNKRFPSYKKIRQVIAALSLEASALGLATAIQCRHHDTNSSLS